MQITSIILQISTITVFLSIFFSVFLLTIKTKNKTSNILLALFLILFAQDSGGGEFVSYYIYPNYPGLGMIINETVFLNIPFLYLYLLSIIYSDFKLRPKHLWHITPFFINILIFMPRFYLGSFDEKWKFLNMGKSNVIEQELSYSLLHIQTLVYFLACFYIINKYRKLLLENFSNASMFNYRWLFQLVIILALGSLVASFKNIFMFFEIETAYNFALVLVNVLSFVMICWIVMKALKNPEIFRGVNSNLQLVKHLITNNKPISKFDLEQELETESINRLSKFMQSEEPFLNPTLSISDLATQVEIPTKELSVLINHNLNQHFFDFINNYRVKKAMQILSNPEKSNVTILEILYEVGFNSKSSFNTAFKKYTHLTPTQFRSKPLN